MASRVAFLVSQMVENLPAIGETQVRSWVEKIPWRREWLPIPVFLPGDFHEQWSLAACSPWGHRVGHDWATNTLGWLWTDKSKVKVINLMFVNILVCAQSCPTLCNPMDCRPPVSSVHESSQAGILEWVAISYSRGLFQSRDRNWVWVYVIKDSWCQKLL